MVFEFRLNKDLEPARLEWKQLHFDNDLFSPRNSFAACAARGKIYIWGGLEMDGAVQKPLSDFLELDVLGTSHRSKRVKCVKYL
jgi:hypothetical protein